MSDWQLKFWRLPQLDNLELLHASRVTHDYPRHMHEEYSIAAILQGTEITNCRSRNHTALPGDLLLINAEEVHSNRSVGSEYRSIKSAQQHSSALRAIWAISLHLPCLTFASWSSRTRYFFAGS